MNRNILKKPNIRFKEFQDCGEWEQRKLREFGKATGGTSIESEFNQNGKYKVISIGSYSEVNKYIDQGIRADKTAKTENRILNKNNLTMILNDKTVKGNIIGRVLLIDSNDFYVYNQRTERIEVYENNFVPNFLYQFLNADNIRLKIIQAAQGNTQIYVNWSTISEFNYNVPSSIEEQTKIGQLFTQLDNLIILHQNKLNKMQKIKKAYLTELFPKNKESSPRKRFKEFTNTWEQRKLQDMKDVRDGTHDSPKYHTEGHPLVTSKNLTDNGLDISEVSFISDEDFNAINQRSKVDVGDIILGMIGTIGKPIILERDDFAIKNVALLKRGGKVDNRFLIQLLKSPIFERYIERENSGGTQKFLGLSQIRNFHFLIPSMDEQIAIGSFFKHLDNLITLHQRE